MRINTMKSLYVLGLLISLSIGIEQFFFPYIFGCFSYIPEAPIQITTAIKYINFFLSLSISGISIILLRTTKKLFETKPGLLTLYAFFVFFWFCRAVSIIILPFTGRYDIAVLSAFIGFFIYFILIPLLSLHKKYAHSENQK